MSLFCSDDCKEGWDSLTPKQRNLQAQEQGYDFEDELMAQCKEDDRCPLCGEETDEV